MSLQEEMPSEFSFQHQAQCIDFICIVAEATVTANRQSLKSCLHYSHRGTYHNSQNSESSGTAGFCSSTVWIHIGVPFGALGFQGFSQLKYPKAQTLNTKTHTLNSNLIGPKVQG